MRREVRHHAASGQALLWHRQGCRDCRDPRSRAQRADEGRRLASRVCLHRHGGACTHSLPAAFILTQTQGRDVDLLFGLDMLKAHQAIIDLEKNVLRIQGREVPFLPEHELPEHARNNYAPDDLVDAPSSGPGAAGPSGSAGATQAQHFPGGGNRLGAPPSRAPGRNTPTVGGGQRLGGPAAPRPAQAQAQGQHPESSISTLTEMGVSREEAVRLLDMAGGNLEVAASMLF
ncbi:hypothetical protein CALVIDRAFT_52695 [Calocera viscosa TUFC12733]|uniref:UBA domain-containing protein n=1 Tax=Calocera viscosa (strain TUFC12733) TaxID=1330018 RepID=A0A167NTE4_CALVF|nr:hypothetical protein CALVIDRAFT_52695 [Calocera viscosa TUFC12733]